MKTTIQNIKNTIRKNLTDVIIKRYYVEDENTVYQRVVVFGMFFCEEMKNFSFFYGCIIGAERSEEYIMNALKIYDNRYEALFKFTSNITI